MPFSLTDLFTCSSFLFTITRPYRSPFNLLVVYLLKINFEKELSTPVPVLWNQRRIIVQQFNIWWLRFLKTESFNFFFFHFSISLKIYDILFLVRQFPCLTCRPSIIMLEFLQYFKSWSECVVFFYYASHAWNYGRLFNHICLKNTILWKLNLNTQMEHTL